MKQAYLAGMIDADGHICWRGGKYAAPNVGITSTSTELMKWLKSELGGNFSVQRKTCPHDCQELHVHRRNIIYKWHVTGAKAFYLLESIRPFLIIKGSKADAVKEQYISHHKNMLRPKRRDFHIAKELKYMLESGWYHSNPQHPE